MPARGRQRRAPAPALTALVKAGSLRWQERLLGKQSAQRVAFDSDGKKVDPASVTGDVYDAGRATVGCETPGSSITVLRVEIVSNGGAPRLWYFPTDAQPRRDQIEVALALAAPLPESATSLKVELRAHCDQFPSIPG
jgi:hypothetical protein